MDYRKIYNNLIQKAKARVNISGYYESHHIVPRCIGGTDDKENLVNLTPEEHYVAHQLLVKIYPTNHKIVNAAAMMIPNRPSNKLYGWLRRRLSVAMSVQQTGEGNSQFESMWIHNRVLKENKKIKRTDVIPEGWHTGRVLNFDKPVKDFNFDYKRAAYDRKKEEARKLANDLFDKFKKSSHNSICSFAVANNTTQPRLCILWKKYVDEYNQKRQHGKSFKN
jgi:hypothetical protein